MYHPHEADDFDNCDSDDISYFPTTGSVPESILGFIIGVCLGVVGGMWIVILMGRVL